MDYSRTLAQKAQPVGQRFDGDVYCSVRRYFAYLIDTILVGIGTALLLFKVGWIHTSTTYVTNQLGQRQPVPHVSYTGGLEGYLVVIGLSLGYFIVLEWTAGFTLGKLFLGLRVVNLSGEQISLTQSVVRNVLLIVDGAFGSIVALISMLTSDCRQRVGDRVAGTMVIRW